VRKQIDGLSGILKGDCGLTNRQRIICERGENNLAANFMQDFTQDISIPIKYYVR
jgi:hypothetical protein